MIRDIARTTRDIDRDAARRTAEVANMSEAIAFGGIIYIVGAALLLLTAFVYARRDVMRRGRSGSSDGNWACKICDYIVY